MYHTGAVYKPVWYMLLLFLSTKDSIDRGPTDRTLALQSRFAVLHGDALGIPQLSLLFALDTII
jgi:hypothetical protein